MRKEIVELNQKLELEVHRIRNMAWWQQSEEYKEEKRISEPVLRAYREVRRTMSRETCELLDDVEEEMYLLKEAELQATYLQGISDCLDYLEKGQFYQRVS